MNRLTALASLRLTCLFALAAAVQACHRPALDAYAKRDAMHQIALLPGDPVTLTSFRGGIEVQGSDSQQSWIRTHSVAGGRNTQEAEWRLEQVRMVDQASSSKAFSMISTDPKPRGLRSDLIAQVPATSYIVAETGEGSIQARNLMRGIRATTRDGAIVLNDVSGNIQAETTRGGIVGKGLTLPASGMPHHFECHNGKIDLEIDAIEAPVFASTRLQPIEISLPIGPGYRFFLTSKKGLSTIRGEDDIIAQSEKGMPLELLIPGTPLVDVHLENHKAPITVRLGRKTPTKTARPRMGL